MENSVYENAIRLAKNADLPEVARCCGLTLKRQGRGYRCKEMDSLNFYQRNGEWRWKRFSTNEGGDSIAFLKVFANKDFIEAIDYLSDGYYSRYKDSNTNLEPVLIKHKPIQDEILPFEPPKDNDDCARTFSYLTDTRCLDSKMIHWLISNDFISQEAQTGNAVFKVYDSYSKEREYVGAELVGTYAAKKFKRIQPHSKSNYGFELRRGTGENIVFCESAIDMLSCMQIVRNDERFQNCRFISMMGVKPNLVKETMKRYHIPPEHVYLGSDNDDAGNMFAKRLIEEFPNMQRIIPPHEKDWNDYLKQISSKCNKKTNQNYERN